MPNSSASLQSRTAGRARFRDRHNAVGGDRSEDAYNAAVSEGWPVSQEVSAASLRCTDVGGAAESGGDSFGVTETDAAQAAEPGMSLEWHKDDPAGDVWSSLVEDGEHGWFEVQLERDLGGWQWVITHERAFWGRARRFEQAKVAVAAQLGRMQQRLPRCEIRPFTENERGYLITFPNFPGIVASGPSPEDAVRRGRDALATYRNCLRPGGEVLSTPDPETGTRPTA
jgi:predicted RNase H-like HicB family nuclease